MIYKFRENKTNVAVSLLPLTIILLTLRDRQIHDNLLHYGDYVVYFIFMLVYFIKCIFAKKYNSFDLINYIQN